MKYLTRHVAAFCAALLFLLVLPGRAHAQAYEAHLADDLATTPELCARVPCAEVFPGAASFSQRKGQPPYVEAAQDPGLDARLRTRGAEPLGASRDRSGHG